MKFLYQFLQHMNKLINWSGLWSHTDSDLYSQLYNTFLIGNVSENTRSNLAFF